MSIGAAIGQLNLSGNDLDFCYLPVQQQGGTPAFAELRAVLDVSRFYSRGGNHAVFALDCEGGQGSGNPHCGPILRDGENLFATARGVIVLADGTVAAETWNGTFSPGLAFFVNSVPGPFDPMAHRCLAVRVRCHYAGGIDVRIRRGLGGAVVFDGALPTAAWPWPGHMRASIGAIALGFVPPKDTGCVEQVVPRSAPDARLGYAALARVV